MERKAIQISVAIDPITSNAIPSQKSKYTKLAPSPRNEDTECEWVHLIEIEWVRNLMTESSHGGQRIRNKR